MGNFQELQPESELPEVSTLEECVNFAGRFTKIYLNKVQIPKNIPGARQREAEIKRGFNSSQQLTEQIVKNFDQVLLNLLLNEEDPLETIVKNADYAPSLTDKLKTNLLLEEKITTEDIKKGPLGAYSSYLVFLFSPMSNIREDVLNNSVPNNVGELLDLCNVISQQRFKDPSRCMASATHRRWAIAYYTTFFVMARKALRNT